MQTYKPINVEKTGGSGLSVWWKWVDFCLGGCKIVKSSFFIKESLKI